MQIRSKTKTSVQDEQEQGKLHSVLLVTQYYPPEIGGGAHRSSGIAEGMKKLGIDVTVVAPFPTYLLRDNERATSWKFWQEQNINGVKVIRSFVIAPDRGKFITRVLYYLTFAFSALINGLLHSDKADVILTISPPLLTGITGALLKKAKGGKLVFDVGDLWPESAIQLGFVKGNSMKTVLEEMERWIYRQSDAVNVVTRDTYKLVSERHPFLKNLFYVPNFVNTMLMKRIPKNTSLCAEFGIQDKVIFGYAGNVGSAQGIHIITDAAKRLTHRKDIMFVIVGDGVEVAKIDKEIRENQLENVLFVPPVPREDIKQYLSIFDYAIIPLLPNELFKITIPSKLYECMAAEIPVILCVDGEARTILEEANAGYYVQPGNSEMLAETVIEAADALAEAPRLGRNGRDYVKKHFDWDLVVADLVEKISAL